MKLVSFIHQRRSSWGVLANEHTVLDLHPLFERTPDLKSLLSSDLLGDVRAALPQAQPIPVRDITWLPPIGNPGKILCVGLNYETHRKETGRPESAHPAIFTRFADTQVGHEQPLVRPRVSSDFDYEGELAVVIGGGGRAIPRAEAMNHVAGFACYNDATARDWQRHTHQFIPGKNFPGTGAFGPALVTADEIPDVSGLSITTMVNGTTVQAASLDQLIFSIPVLIEYCSTFTPLSPGDIIATGTPGGVGFKRNPPLFLKAGDVVTVEVSGVGLLRNVVEDEGAAR